MEGFRIGRPFPAVNIYELDDEILLTAELPGVSADELELSVANGMLTLKEVVESHLLCKRSGIVEVNVPLATGSGHSLCLRKSGTKTCTPSLTRACSSCIFPKLPRRNREKSR